MAYLLYYWKNSLFQAYLKLLIIYSIRLNNILKSQIFIIFKLTPRYLAWVRVQSMRAFNFRLNFEWLIDPGREPIPLFDDWLRE